MSPFKNKTEVQNTLSKYIPKPFISYASELLQNSGIEFRIVAPRKTKLGDFRMHSRKRSRAMITINGNLNPYAFLITFLHEMAHLHAYNKYNLGIKAHGKEWKYEFQQLLKPLIDAKEFPENLKQRLLVSVKNTKASSCSDMGLSRELRKFDLKTNTIPLEDICIGDTFKLNKKSFKKGKLRRTRYLCIELNTGNGYLIHALAEVNSL